MAADCRCYALPELTHIRDRLINAEKCAASLAEKDLLLAKRAFAVEPTTWWQEPSVVVSGVVVSLSVGAVIGYLAAKR